MLRCIAAGVLCVLMIVVVACSEVQPTVETVPSATPTATAIITPTVVVAISTDTPVPAPTSLPTDFAPSSPTPMPTLDFSAYTNGDVYPGAYGNPHTGTHANFGTYANSDAIACVGEQAESGAYGRHCRDYN
jgi:hypothetical protein